MSTLTIIQGLRICTEFVYPPIPDRNYDWQAWVEGEEESNICGRGRTESDAVAELLATLEEVRECHPESLVECYCDNTHAQNATVCMYCFHRNKSEVSA